MLKALDYFKWALIAFIVGAVARLVGSIAVLVSHLQGR